MKSPKIFIANTAFYANNKGVETLTKASISIIKKCFPNAEIIIWQTPPEGMDIATDYINKHGRITIYKEKSASSFLTKTVFYILFLIMRTYKLKNEGLLHDMVSSDIIINLNYGDLFTDVYYGKKIWCLMILSNIVLLLSKRPIVLFPQSIGPFKGRLSRIIATKLLNSSVAIMVREKYSREILTETLGIDDDKILSTFDVGFLLKPASKKRIEEILSTERMPENAPRPFVGLIYNPYVQEKARRVIINLTRAIEKSLNGTLILIPHSVSQNELHNGGTFNSLIENQLRTYGCQNVFSFNGKYSAEEIKGLIGLCDAIITFPTHAAIAALSQGIPTIALSYSHKTTSIFEDFGLEKYVILFSESLKITVEQPLKDLLEELIENESLVKKRTLERCAEIEETILENIENLLKMRINHQ